MGLSTRNLTFSRQNISFSPEKTIPRVKGPVGFLTRGLLVGDSPVSGESRQLCISSRGKQLCQRYAPDRALRRRRSLM